MARAAHLAPPAAIVFDWDNTLVDGWAAITAGLNEALAAFGMAPWSEQDTRERARRSIREAFPDLFGAEWRRAAAIFQAAYQAQHLSVLRRMKGADGLLAACARYPCAVVSNKDGAMVRRESQALGWDGYFHAIVGAGDAVADKPDRAPFELALRPLGLRPGPCIWYVGDTGLDMQAARECGCVGVLLGNAEHDGGVAALVAGNAPPHAHFVDADALAAYVQLLA